MASTWPSRLVNILTKKHYLQTSQFVILELVIVDNVQGLTKARFLHQFGLGEKALPSVTEKNLGTGQLYN
jgi:hypothetical protein